MVLPRLRFRIMTYSRLGRLGRSELLLSNLPSPWSQGLDNLWCDGDGQRYSDKDEGFMNGVGENELGPEGLGYVSREKDQKMWICDVQASSLLRASASGTPHTLPSLAAGLPTAVSTCSTTSSALFPTSGMTALTASLMVPTMACSHRATRSVPRPLTARKQKGRSRAERPK